MFKIQSSLNCIKDLSVDSAACAIHVACVPYMNLVTFDQT